MTAVGTLCDADSAARAKVRVDLPVTGAHTLYLCQHCADKQADALRAVGATMMPLGGNDDPPEYTPDEDQYLNDWPTC